MPVPPALYVDNESMAIKYLAGVEPAYSGNYRTDFVMLPRHMSTSMLPFVVRGLRFAIKLNLSEDEISDNPVQTSRKRNKLIRRDRDKRDLRISRIV
jgi:outer membrane scaffolding protein for murein synthesis (MipA/OmpV family)